MKREEQIREASAAYVRVKCPIAMGRDRFKNMIDSINANPAFIAGAEWADSNQPSPWISVEDKLPEINKDGESVAVFVRVINKHTKEEWIEQPAKYNINIKDWIAMDFTHIGKRDGIVTHWMPIPELPKEE